MDTRANRIFGPRTRLAADAGDAPGAGRLARPLEGLTRKGREKRLLRAVRRLYPALQNIEAKVLPAGQQVLGGAGVDQVLGSDLMIERGLSLFEAAWQAGLVQVVGADGRPLKSSDRKTPTACCRLSVEAAEKVLIDRAMEIIFADNTFVLEKLRGTVTAADGLARIRLVAPMHNLSMVELTKGLGMAAGQVLGRTDPEALAALATLKPYHMRALRTAMKGDFKGIGRWNPALIRAIGEHFDCVEQIRDLGPEVALIEDPESIAILARWTKTDITDTVNAERKKRGKRAVKGRRFETDIGTLRSLTGGSFAEFIARPPGMLASLGNLLAELREMDVAERKTRVDQLLTFANRYMEYLSPEAMAALGMVAGDTPVPGGGPAPTFGEALNILEGLWLKQGLGRPFFEKRINTPAGVKALAGLIANLNDMKSRGSIKRDQNVRDIISSTELLDGSLGPVLDFRKAA
ncbi:hypothetical protein [Roseospirillum parvum]|uniref:Uncharacterized protein n=1 Tax=Roseospirillum parvum TaxID=83401 RepID=A0A1G7WJS2_9PROT|nr:hypothetical protein [Roseospirillum parvum]SDG72089.1 hypothetical protein SAMN05421742_102222 [Roseospirillum parvum]